MKWLPIETAPKDGTCVLVSGGRAREDKGCGYDKWESRVGSVDMCCFSYRTWYGDETRDGIMIHEPTHWMPLPEPPEEV